MRIVLWIVGGIGALVVLLCIVALLLPREAAVERSIVIDAQPETIFTLINGFERYNEWSPWADIDPDTRYEYGGPATGVGAWMTWHSDDPNAGSGRQEIISSQPYRSVGIDLSFDGMGTAQTGFVLEPADGGTSVVWMFHTDFGYNLPMRLMGPFFDRMLGPDYEKGLAKLKEVVERQ